MVCSECKRKVSTVVACYVGGDRTAVDDSDAYLLCFDCLQKTGVKRMRAPGPGGHVFMDGVCESCGQKTTDDPKRCSAKLNALLSLISFEGKLSE